MTIIFTQIDNLGPFWVKIYVILGISLALRAVLSFSTWEKSRDSIRNSQKLGHLLKVAFFRKFDWAQKNMPNHYLKLEAELRKGGILKKTVLF